MVEKRPIFDSLGSWCSLIIGLDNLDYTVNQVITAN